MAATRMMRASRPSRRCAIGADLDVTCDRHPDFPNVPTMVESGYRSVDGGPPFGCYAPKGTPAALVAQLNAEVNKVLDAPDMK